MYYNAPKRFQRDIRSHYHLRFYQEIGYSEVRDRGLLICLV